MAAYCQVYGVIHFMSPAGWLPVHRDQLRAQRSVMSMGKLYLFTVATCVRCRGIFKYNFFCFKFTTDSLNNNCICISTLGATVMIWEKFISKSRGSGDPLPPSWGRPMPHVRMPARWTSCTAMVESSHFTNFWLFLFWSEVYAILRALWC